MVSERLVWLVVALVGVPAAAAESLPDPMRPADFEASSGDGSEAQAATPRPTLVLQSVLVAGNRRSAVINGQSVGIGSRIAGARVVAIQPGRVGLRDDEGAFTLRLPSTNAKRRASTGDSK